MNNIQDVVAEACEHLIQIVFENDVEYAVRTELLALLRNLQDSIKK